MREDSIGAIRGGNSSSKAAASWLAAALYVGRGEASWCAVQAIGACWSQPGLELESSSSTTQGGRQYRQTGPTGPREKERAAENWAGFH